MLDGTACDVPNTNDLVLGTGGQVPAIRAEAYAPDVEIAVFRKAAILEMRNRVSRLNIEDLGRTIATGCNITTVKTEAHAADDTLVRQVVDEVDVEDAPCPRIEDGVPVVAFPLVLSRQLLDVQVGQNVTLGQGLRD